MNTPTQKSTSAYVLASWVALAVGTAGFLIGLWNAELGIEEKGYYFTVLAFGLFAAVSVQKSVRDRLEGIPVSDLYYGICWFGIVLAVALLAIGLFNATKIDMGQKGFYAMAYVLCIFSAITVQKNTRDQLQLSMEGEGVQPQAPQYQAPISHTSMKN